MRMYALIFGCAHFLQQTTPPPAAPDSLINYNMLSVDYVKNIFRAILIIRGT